MSDIRTKTWYGLVDSKTNEFLAGAIVKKYQKWDLGTNVLLALTTSTGIGGWVVWSEYPWIWGLLIGASQIAAIIKPNFLLPKYIKVFDEKSIRWQFLALDYEELWYDIESQNLSNDAAKTKYFNLRKHALTFDNTPVDIIFFKTNAKSSRRNNSAILI